MASLLARIGPTVDPHPMSLRLVQCPFEKMKIKKRVVYKQIRIIPDVACKSYRPGESSWPNWSRMWRN
ncbi:hypothetical protein T02_11195, partial [Trichinella nativa]